jgi:hypothetical protein
MSQNVQCILQVPTFRRRSFYSCTWVGICDLEGTWKWTDICRRDDTVTVGTQFLWNTELVDCRYCSLLGLTAYWIAWWHLKFCWSSWLVYINFLRDTSLYVCVCVHDSFKVRKNLLVFMKLRKTLCHLRPHQLIILNSHAHLCELELPQLYLRSRYCLN